jgi:LPXTG-motif cell wall-anchored protein
MFSRSVKRIAAATFAGAALTLTPVAMPAANAAPPVGCPSYQGATTTQTTVSISPSSPDRGETFTATANVTVAGVPATGGTVTFRYNGKAKTDTVVAGEASVTFVARVNGAVVARYSGVCPGGAAAVAQSSRGTADILGVEAFGGRSNAGVGGVAGGSGGGGIGGLAATGLDSQTELFGLLGAGLVAVGGLSLMVHRRRTQG